MTPAAGAAAPDPSFDRTNWPPARARTGAACLLLALAVTLGLLGGIWRLAACLLVLDVVVQLLPWKYPRSARSTASIWAEYVLYLTAPVVMVVAAVASGQRWLTALPAPLWWPAAALAAAGLVWLSGMPLRALFSGDLAFLAKPVSRPHKAAGCVSTLAAPAGEEFLFRAPLLAASGLALLPVGLLGAAAFVARHHLPPGLHERTQPRVLATQVAAAVALGLLTWASRSIYPALLAHYLNNVPSFLLAAGRPTTGGPRLAPAGTRGLEAD